MRNTYMRIMHEIYTELLQNMININVYIYAQYTFAGMMEQRITQLNLALLS